MDWFEVMPDNYLDLDMETVRERSRVKPIGVERMNIEDTPAELTVIGQFFIAPLVLVDSNTVLQIPLRDEGARQAVIKHLVPHFRDCKILNFEDGSST